MLSRSVIAAAAVFLSAANAHMFINSPAPIAGTAPKDPLFDDGSNFPCHGAQFITGKGGQNLAVGSSQPLTFELAGGLNTAVHGGGSCQVSLTYETDPQKVKDPNNWKVLYSIIGGCPTNNLLNLDGNYPKPDGNGTYSGALACSDPKSNGFNCVNQFSFTVPKEVKNGKATLGFTWFNAVGNREMYMNCADVTITGGTDQGNLNSLPAMHIANIAAGGMTKGTDCSTPEQVYPAFPNPGQYVLTKTVDGAAKAYAGPSAYPIKPFTGVGCKAAVAQATGQASSPQLTAQAAPTSASKPTQSAQNSGFIGNSPRPTQGSNPGAVFAPGAASATFASVAKPTPAAASSAGAAAPSAAAPAAAAPKPQTPSTGSSGSGSTSSSNSSGSSGSSGNCAAGSSPCATHGQLVCLDRQTWGTCNWGCVTHMRVAAGTMCDGGAIKLASSKSRRAMHPHGLAHRRSSIV